MDLSKINSGPTEYKLREVSLFFKEAEDQQVQEGQPVATVSVRTVTASDDIRRAELLVEKHLKYIHPETYVIVDEVTGFNQRLREMYEAYYSIWAITGLEHEGADMFPQTPITSMPLPVFEQIWNSLPLFVTDAIHDAVIFTNPRWATE